MYYIYIVELVSGLYSYVGIAWTRNIYDDTKLS